MIKKFKDFLKEAYVDDSGNLKDMDFEPSSWFIP